MPPPRGGRGALNRAGVGPGGGVVPLLAALVSAGVTALNEGVDGLATVTEMTMGADGSVTGAETDRALVRNQAKLAYNATAEWLRRRNVGS